VKKKYLITGGSGFIGTNLCSFLTKKNFVINADKISYSSVPDKFKKINIKNYVFVKLDISNKEKIKNILLKHKVDYIINLAAETHVDRSIDDPEAFIKKNIESCLSLIEVVKNMILKKELKKNIKFIHISTDEVFGDVKKPVNENGRYLPNSPYAASKASIDLLLRSYYKTFKFPYVICHPSNNYGPFQFPEKLIPKIISNLINSKNIEIYGNGKNIREWIFVEDTCEAIEVICNKGKIGNSYNVGSGFRIDNLKLTKTICNIYDEITNNSKSHKLIKMVKDRPGHDKSYFLNSKKFNKLSIINNKNTFKEKIYYTIKWYLNNENWIKHCFKKFSGKRLGIIK
jgi:dTDP-glucose 4,6-dehydratase